MAELAYVLVPGSVEEEHTFSTHKFIKNDLRNRLSGHHLNACMRIFSQDFYTLETFPLALAAALDIWSKTERGRYMGAPVGPGPCKCQAAMAHAKEDFDLAYTVRGVRGATPPEKKSAV